MQYVLALNIACNYRRYRGNITCQIYGTSKCQYEMTGGTTACPTGNDTHIF